MGSIAVVANETGGRRTNDVWRVITSLVLDGISSRHTRRAYSQALDEFLIWFLDDPGREFDKAAVQKYRAEVEIKGLAASSINIRLSAVRRPFDRDRPSRGLAHGYSVRNGPPSAYLGPALEPSVFV